MAGFIQFTDVEGESKDAKHQKWTNVISFAHPVSKPVLPGQSGSARTPGDTVAGDIHVTLQLDKSGPLLAAHCAAGTRFDNVKIELTASVGEKKRSTYWTYDLTKVYITSHSLGGATQAEGTATQDLSLNAEVIGWKYTVHDENGNPIGDVEKGFNTESGEIE